MKQHPKTRFCKKPIVAAISSILAVPLIIHTPVFAAELEEVLVTARKRDESAKDVPVAISVMSADAITKAGVSDITQFFALIPSVENNSDGSRIASKPAIRGVGSQENASIRAKVTTFIDGVPIIGSQGISSFAGLEHVEVLRGPQSSAFGRSTFGGAINYITKDPGNEFEAKVRLGLGTDGTREIGASLSAPVVQDKLALSIALEEKNYDGPDEWQTTSGDQLGSTNDNLAIIKLAFTPSDSLSGEIMYFRQEVDDAPPPVLFANLDQLVAHPDDADGLCAINGGAGSCVILGEIDPVPLVFDYDYDNAANPVLDPGTRIKRDRIQGSLSKYFDNGLSLTALAANTEEVGDTWFDRDTFTGGVPIHVGSSPESDEQYAEIRLASSVENRFNWLVGASLYEYDYLNTVYANRSAGVVMDLFSESASNTGLFFNLGYELNERVTGTFEGRFQSDEITGSLPATVANGLAADIVQSSTTDSFQPRLSLNYVLNDDNNLYFQVARGTNPAGFNANALDPTLLLTAADEGYDLPSFQTFEEEEMTNFEFGIKGGSAENGLTYTANIYYLDWSGYVVPVTGNWTPDDSILLPGTTANDYFSRLFLNTGDLDGLGIELEGSWAATEQLLIGGAFSHSGLEFTDDSCSPIPLDYGVAAISTDPFACASVAGAVPPMVSQTTAALNGTYTWFLSGDKEAYTRVDYQYRSKRYTEQINTDWLPAFSLVNLRMGLRSDTWSAELYANNLFDEDSPAGAVRFFDGRLPGMVFNTSILARTPRIIGINLEYKF